MHLTDQSSMLKPNSGRKGKATGAPLGVGAFFFDLPNDTGLRESVALQSFEEIVKAAHLFAFNHFHHILGAESSDQSVADRLR